MLSPTTHGLGKQIKSGLAKELSKYVFAIKIFRLLLINIVFYKMSKSVTVAYLITAKSKCPWSTTGRIIIDSKRGFCFSTMFVWLPST